MSILIKGIDMPKEKTISVVIHPDGTAYAEYIFAGVCTEYLKDCVAVPVPAHGDLVERKAVLNTFSTHMNRTMHYVTIRDTVPTIILAEEGE